MKWQHAYEVAELKTSLGFYFCPEALKLCSVIITMSGAGPQVTPTISPGTSISAFLLAEVKTLVSGITSPSESVFWIQTLQTELSFDGNISPLLNRHGDEARTACCIVGVVVVVQLSGVSSIL